MVEVTYEMIAAAIIALYWDRILEYDEDSLIHWLFAQKYRKKKGPFAEILQNVFPDYSEKTIHTPKNLAKCWYAFHSNAPSIKSILKARKHRYVDTDGKKQVPEDEVLDRSYVFKQDKQPSLQNPIPAEDMPQVNEQLDEKDLVSKTNEFNSDQASRSAKQNLENSVPLDQRFNTDNSLLHNDQQADAITRADNLNEDNISSHTSKLSGAYVFTKYEKLCESKSLRCNELLKDDNLREYHKEFKTKDPLTLRTKLNQSDSSSQFVELSESNSNEQYREKNQDNVIAEKGLVHQVVTDAHTNGISGKSTEQEKFTVMINSIHPDKIISFNQINFISFKVCREVDRVGVGNRKSGLET